MERLDDHAINLFTDGSCLQRPRRGGYAFLVVTVDEQGREVVDDYSPNGVPGATNQEMELRAVVEALKLLSSPSSPVNPSLFSKVVIYTDSMFVHKNFATAKFEWPRQGWMRRSGPPVVHAELWKELVREVKRVGMPVHIEWVKGKSSRHSKLVDKLAKDSARRPYARPTTVRSVRRKRSSASVEASSVGVEGQEIEIQITATEYLRTQKLCRYKYEVMSEDSPYFGKVDFLFSDEALKHRYIYRVRLNDDPAYPQIAEVIEVVGPARRASEEAADAV